MFSESDSFFEKLTKSSHNYIKTHSRMHPIALFHKKNSQKSIPSNPLTTKLNSVIRLTTQAECIIISPHYLKIPPVFGHGILPLTIHSGTPPPPTIGYVTIMPC